jgi:hypothetical protein
MKTGGKPRPLWRCPKCGKFYVTRNMWHACSRHTLWEHFAGRDPKLRLLFDGFVGLLKRCGPVRIVPGKTGIAIQQRMRFAGVYVRKHHLEAGFLLPRRVEHPRMRKIVAYSPSCIGHHLDIRSPADLDAELASWLREAYRVGRQEALLAGRRAGPQAAGDFSWSEYSAKKPARPAAHTRATRRTNLWACPKCGRRFPTRNQMHLCSKLTIGAALKGRTPEALKLFGKLATMARRCGAAQIVPQKTRIAFQARNTFLGVRFLRHALDCEILLPRRIEHPRFSRIISASPGSHYHRLRISTTQEVDSQVGRWLRLACRGR